MPRYDLSQQRCDSNSGATIHNKSQPRFEKQTDTQWRVILHLRIPGSIPGGYPEYPDPLRGGFLTVGV